MQNEGNLSILPPVLRSQSSRTCRRDRNAGEPHPARGIAAASGAHRRADRPQPTMSRATIDLGMAGRLRAMASEFQTKATEQDAECPGIDHFKLRTPS